MLAPWSMHRRRCQVHDDGARCRNRTWAIPLVALPGGGKAVVRMCQQHLARTHGGPPKVPAPRVRRIRQA